MLLSSFQSGHWWQSPQRCILCHDLATQLYLCHECLALLPPLLQGPQTCPLCAKPSLQAAVCGHCQQHPPAFEHLWASYHLAWPLHQLLHAYKFEQQWSYASVFAMWMLQAPPPWLADAEFDAVVAMPLSRRRLLARGYNQAQLLAEGINTAVTLTSDVRVMVEREHRPAQSTLTVSERLRNARGCFNLKSDVKKRNLLLIDDVVTTSATLNELARILKTAGAERVSCWTLARA